MYQFSAFFSAILISRNESQGSPRPLYKSKKKFLQSTLCGYSKLVSWDAWHNAKDENLIRSSCDEKTSKNCWNNAKFDFTQFLTVFERFLSPGRSDLCLVFCIVSGVSRHKFRVPTKGTLEEFFFRLIKGSGRTLWLIAGDQDGWEKSWKSVHSFIITFLTIYFLGKIIWQLFEKMGHPTGDRSLEPPINFR